jgi:hypothetical protein
LITSLINGGYVAVYFDFNKSTPTNVSTRRYRFYIDILRNNPTAKIDIGHADFPSPSYLQQSTNYFPLLLVVFEDGKSILNEVDLGSCFQVGRLLCFFSYNKVLFWEAF